MTCQTSPAPAYGTDSSNTQFEGWATRLRSRLPLPKPPTNPLERLVEIMHSNERLMNDLAMSRERIVKARAYLDEVDCNLQFGQAHLERCRIKHSGILAQLRANRVEALNILASCEPAA